jgi:hypothetical protein
MAGVIGNAAGGYATVNPVQDNFGQALENVENSNQKFREFQQMQLDRKAKKALDLQEAMDKQAKQDLDDNEKINAIKVKDSGISGIDSALQNGANAARKAWLEGTNNFRKTRDRKYLDQANLAMSNLNALANIPDSYRKAIDNLHQGVLNGTVDRSELKRVEKLGNLIEKGVIEPKFEKGTMTFDVYERDPKTGEISSLALKNLKGEDIINQLTPAKQLDYNKHIKDVQGLAGKPVKAIDGSNVVEGVPNVEKFAQTKADQLLANTNLLDDVANFYQIEEEPEGGYSPENRKLIYNKYYNDILSGFNKETMPNYEGMNQARADERLKLSREANARERDKKEGKGGESKAFTPPVLAVTKGGYNVGYGMNIAKGESIYGPTYDKGKDGPVKGVYRNPDGSLSFSLKIRKNDDLNATGLKKQAEQGDSFQPSESDYVNPISKPTVYNTKTQAHLIEPYVRGMINPTNGKYFTSLADYESVYKKYKSPNSRSKAQPKKTTTKKANTVVGVADKNL